MRRSLYGSFGKDIRGATAVEFAIIAPIFLALLVGIFQSAMLLFTISSLHYASQNAARCASVNSVQCSDAASISAFAQSNYYAFGNSPVFSASKTACGNEVTGSLDFDFNVLIYRSTIPLASSACFPSLS